jgi:transposase
MENVTLTKKEQTRVTVLTEVTAGRLTAQEAAGLLGISVRQLRRLLAGYRSQGVAALAHGNRGRSPAHTIDAATRERVRDLAQTRYAGCNQHHLTDLLQEREGIALSRSTVRRILSEGGIRSPRTHRVPAHRTRRERYPQEGMLLQMDGSPHAWLEERGPRLCLLAAIDDATGTVPAAVFREQEDAHGYLLLLQQLISSYGRPLAVYHDRHSIFLPPTHQKQTLEEQLAGIAPATQVSRALAELGIRSIAAHSPQAKGRIERLFGTLQDRLLVELRLAGATSCQQANQLLPSFLPRFNAQFGVPAREPGRAYRALEAGCDLAAICCFKYERVVAADNTVRLGEHRIQLAPGPGRMSYAKARVAIQERLDGSVVVVHAGTTVATTPAPAEAPVLRARPTNRPAPQKETVQPVAGAAVGSGGMWAAEATPPSADLPGRPHIPAARTPGPDHPFRKSYKTIPVTKSLDV